jgi:hypothetical protein
MTLKCLSRAAGLTLSALLVVACSDGSTDSVTHVSAGGAGTGGTANQGGGAGTAGAGGNGGVSAGGSSGAGGSAGSGGLGGSANAGSGGTPLTPVTGTPGVWERVTSPEMDPAVFTGPGGFGIGSIVNDPGRPSDLYVGGYGSLWRSTDYGATWNEVNSNPKPGSQALGHVVAVAGTTPATVWMANGFGDEHVYVSTDAGETFRLTGTITDGPTTKSGLYSIVVDPNDSTHLLSGFHEANLLVESTDSGETWHYVSGEGWPENGVSWFAYFIDTGEAAHSTTWFAIAQDGGSALMTKDAGAHWAECKGAEGVSHPHGGTGIFQNGNTLYIAGFGGPGGAGDGVYRSLDLGENWEKVAGGQEAVVFGSSKNVYTMYGWACASCTLPGVNYQVAPIPGDSGTWITGTVPDELNWGPNSVATTSDGIHTVFVGSMWATGLWRYIEP